MRGGELTTIAGLVFESMLIVPEAGDI